MNMDISAILANFVIASVIMFLTDRERKELLLRVTKAETAAEKLQEKYTDDLRDWSGLNPRVVTWNSAAREAAMESDTKIRAYMLSADEKARAEALMTA